MTNSIYSEKNGKMAMNTFFRIVLLVAALLACGGRAVAQLPNEKFGKPSKMEWEFVGWGDATQADAIVLCKTMKATYELSDRLTNSNQSYSEITFDNLPDFGKNELDESSMLVKYEVRLRTKILTSEGARHANVDITYYDADDDVAIDMDNLTGLKVTVFTRDAKGKVAKRRVGTDGFVKERVDSNYVVVHVVVPDVEAGSIIEYQYNITSTRPTFLYDWVFQERIPTVRSKCDFDIPAFLQFNMNAPIDRHIKSTVTAGRLAYDLNRPDMKKPKSCPTNHYVIVGDYIHPEDETVAAFTSRIVKPVVTPPADLPKGHTHLKIQ